MTAIMPMRTTAPATPPSVRGGCPALGAPMRTGDGLLARIGLDGGIHPADLVRIGELARCHGNGLIDISARGNIQIRGLTEASALTLEDDIRQLGLPLRDGIAVETSALAGADPHEISDPEPLATAVRECIRRHGLGQRLAAKFAVVVDGGGQLPLHALLADVRLVAVRRQTGLFWQMLLGGTTATGRSVGLVADADAQACMSIVLTRIAAMDAPARGRDLDPAEVRAWLRCMIEAEDARPIEHGLLPFGILPLMARPALPPGAGAFDRVRRDHSRMAAPLHATIRDEAKRNAAAGGDFHAARIGIPFGQCPAETVMELGRRAQAAGIDTVRPAIDHSLVFFGGKHACRTIIDYSKDLILSQDDPRALIAACPGQPACASATLKTHALGGIAARNAASLLDGSFTLHLSGCGKGCAHPARALIGLVGTNDGTALIFNGKTSDMPLELIRHGEEAKALAALATLLRLERGIGETTRDCLLRLGAARVAEAVSQGQS